MREEYINILENKIVKRFKSGQQMSKNQDKTYYHYPHFVSISLLSVILDSRKGLMERLL